ncbi:thiamine phosphate synthase [Aurantiacibacter flavus]|uniref:Thiamine phosphate synthase n=1 Tax=Aurantiacibacter flavus TaxID=3145232 RepID=A0ABV0CYP3_9SPHN
MHQRQSLPNLWLLSDARNDGVLEEALTRLPRGSAFVYRHYHLPPRKRIARWWRLRDLCLARDHLLVLADSALTAREWGAQGTYGAPLALYPQRADLVQIATAHTMREIAQANRKRADAIMLSPAFATRSHPGAPHLGPVRWHLFAAHAQMPVIALGGMTAQTARRLGTQRWAAIDGLSAS